MRMLRLATTSQFTDGLEEAFQLILKPPLVVSAVTVGTLAEGAPDVAGPCTKAGLPDAIVTLEAPIPRLIKPPDIDHVMMVVSLDKFCAMTVQENAAALLFGSAMTLLVSGLLPSVVSREKIPDVAIV